MVPTFDAPRDLARSRLLDANGLSEKDLASALESALRPETDLADLFLEERFSETWRLADGRISGGSFSIDGGFGLRTVSEDRTAFAHSGDISAAALGHAAAATREGARGAGLGGLAIRPAEAGESLYAALDPTGAWTMSRKTALLEEVERRARSRDPRIIKVFATLSLACQIVLLLREDGLSSADVRPIVRLDVQVVAEQNGRRESGFDGVGGRYGLDDLNDAALDACVEKAARIALVNLDARPAPAGPMTVVLAPGYPGVLFHEAIGHGLEGDFIRKRTSVFSGRLGERVAAPGVTVIDDGAIPRARGSLNVDDEGSDTGPTVLIEDGVLAGFIQDRMNAGLTNRRPTGNGRRQSYAHLPMPRMTNTFLANGDRDPQEIIASVKNGIYAAEFGGGQVDIVSGAFNFSTVLAYRIEDGRITAPIRGATLTGEGVTSLRKIAMVGDDFALDAGVAVCGKQGQTLPVSVGQPTLRIDDMIVGGAV